MEINLPILALLKMVLDASKTNTMSYKLANLFAFVYRDWFWMHPKPFV
jgi:hypothetical protein